LPVQAVNPFAPDFLRLSGAWRQSIPAIGARLRSLSGQESKRGRVADRPKQIIPALPRTETELLRCTVAERNRHRRLVGQRVRQGNRTAIIMIAVDTGRAAALHASVEFKIESRRQAEPFEAARVGQLPFADVRLDIKIVKIIKRRAPSRVARQLQRSSKIDLVSPVAPSVRIM